MDYSKKGGWTTRARVIVWLVILIIVIIVSLTIAIAVLDYDRSKQKSNTDLSVLDVSSGANVISRIVRITKQVAGAGTLSLYWDPNQNKCVATASLSPYASWIMDSIAVTPSEGQAFTLRPTSQPQMVLTATVNGDLALTSYPSGSNLSQFSWTQWNSSWQINANSTSGYLRMSLYYNKPENVVGTLLNAWNFDGSANWNVQELPNLCMTMPDGSVVGCSVTGYNCGNPLNAAISTLAQCSCGPGGVMGQTACNCTGNGAQWNPNTKQCVIVSPSPTNTSGGALPTYPTTPQQQCPSCAAGQYPNCQCPFGSSYNFTTNTCTCADGRPPSLPPNCACPVPQSTSSSTQPTPASTNTAPSSSSQTLQPQSKTTVWLIGGGLLVLLLAGLTYTVHKSTKTK